jgi:aspartyl-tRNA(Asn)/glutamyl-tRNA(Gln) amidotransferase subunit A
LSYHCLIHFDASNNAQTMRNAASDNRAYTRREALLAGSALAAVACADWRAGADLADFSLEQLSAAIRARRVSAFDAVNACLRRIETANPAINALLYVDRERAVASARQADREIAAGRWRGPLHGVPIAIKDNIDVADMPCTAASQVFADRTPTKNAAVIDNLKENGAIILGKLNLHEFGFGASGTIGSRGPVRNPWNEERAAGGSSSGPAAAVATGCCFGALGTDTGGSIRIPAAFCGVVGLKPTYGLVSLEGVVPMAKTYDHVGPICRTARDVELMFDAMISPDALRSAASISDLRVGVVQDRLRYCDENFPAEVELAFDRALKVVASLVKSVVPADLPAAIPDRIIEAEAYRFHASLIEKSSRLYAPQTLESILSGQGVSEAELNAERRELARYRTRAAGSFNHFDVIVAPTVLRTAPRLADAPHPFDSVSACTFLFNAAGLPALSVPMGLFADGIPMGLTIAGPPLSERSLVALASAFEARTGRSAPRFSR